VRAAEKLLNFPESGNKSAIAMILKNSFLDFCFAMHDAFTHLKLLNEWAQVNFITKGT